MSLIFSIAIALLATMLLNQNGTFTTNKLRCVASLILQVTSLILFIVTFGIARGSFIYLAAIALIGILITSSTNLFKNKT